MLCILMMTINMKRPAYHSSFWITNIHIISNIWIIIASGAHKHLFLLAMCTATLIGVLRDYTIANTAPLCWG